MNDGEGCELCIEEGVVRVVFAIHAGHPLCMDHLRDLIETLLFIAREGPQREEDIDQHLARFRELYPYPDKVAE